MHLASDRHWLIDVCQGCQGLLRFIRCRVFPSAIGHFTFERVDAASIKCSSPLSPEEESSTTRGWPEVEIPWTPCRFWIDSKAKRLASWALNFFGLPERYWNGTVDSWRPGEKLSHGWKPAWPFYGPVADAKKLGTSSNWTTSPSENLMLLMYENGYWILNTTESPPRSDLVATW